MEPGDNHSGLDQKTLQPYAVANNRFLGKEHKKTGKMQSYPLLYTFFGN